MNGIGQGINYLEAGWRQFPEGEFRPVLISFLGLVLLWSGLAKARSPRNAAFAFVDFGILRRPSVPLIWAIIAGELGLGALLLVTSAISTPLVLAATSIATFTFASFATVTTRALRRGHSFECACFGSGGGEVTMKTSVRSAALSLLAGLCAAGGSAGAPLAPEELALTWCAAAGLLGTAVLLVRARQLAQLPAPSLDSAS